MNAKAKIAVLFCMILVLLGIPSLQAQWIENGVSICTVTNNQYDPQLISDGAGGAIITWQDPRSGNSDIYAQRISSGGSIQWTADGVSICTATNIQWRTQLVSDGSGGAIITWQDERSGNYDIYAQRISSGGSVQWTADGVSICTATNDQTYPQIISDGSGGAIITWQDNRSGNYDIYAQRISSGGSVQWTADGVSICTATNGQQNPQIISNSLGGAIITWVDDRSGNEDIYAQRINSGGSATWTVNGVSICTATNRQDDPQLVSDGSGGAIITWEDERSPYYDIYAQRISYGGSVQWTADGVSICTATNNQDGPQLVSDGSGGAIITWVDDRSGNEDIYAQRISYEGSVQWTADGISICTVTNNQRDPQLVSDGAGGAIITWEDPRSGYYDIYAQRINSGGSVQWTADGLSICTVINEQYNPQIISDGSGGAIITWHDYRNGNDYDIYAQRIERNGYWGYPSPSIAGVRDVPGDEGGFVNLSWDASRLDIYPEDHITQYTIWRAIDETAATAMLGQGAFLIDGALDINHQQLFDNSLQNETVPSYLESTPIVRRDMLGSNPYYWKYVATVESSYYIDKYSEEIPTMFDSTETSAEYHYFQVIAHESDPIGFWVSAVDSGYSVDNLSPGFPGPLMGMQNTVPPGLLLVWKPITEPDLSNYAVYRELSEDFAPDSDNLVAAPKDTTYFDADWRPKCGYYYKVSAVDVHGNESRHALLRPEDIEGEEIPEVPLASYLSQNFPNPFNPSTRIAFGVRESGVVTLRIYDISGRLVRTLVDGKLETSHYEKEWDGRDSNGRFVSSGIYFYRLVAGDFMQTRKMALLR